MRTLSGLSSYMSQLYEKKRPAFRLTCKTADLETLRAHKENPPDQKIRGIVFAGRWREWGYRAGSWPAPAGFHAGGAVGADYL